MYISLSPNTIDALVQYSTRFFILKLSGLNQCKLLDGGTVFFKGSTCLVEACMNRDMGMIDLLLKYGARDDDCKVIHCVQFHLISISFY